MIPALEAIFGDFGNLLLSTVAAGVAASVGSGVAFASMNALMGIDALFASSGIFRDQSDPRMMYVMFASPFVSSLAVAIMLRVLSSVLVSAGGSAFSLNKVLSFLLLWWLVGTAHGIAIDHGAYKQPAEITYAFFLQTLVIQLVQGAVHAHLLRPASRTAKHE
jgi:hypothetical protein